MLDEDLIGKKFKLKSKYGVSEWTDTVDDCWIIWWGDLTDYKDNGRIYTTPQFKIRGKRAGIIYDLSELIFV